MIKKNRVMGFLISIICMLTYLTSPITYGHSIISAEEISGLPIFTNAPIEDFNDTTIIAPPQESNKEKTLINVNGEVKEIVTTITTFTIPVTTKTTTTTIVKKDKFFFKPETHYVHKEGCKWLKSGKRIHIENTKDIEARACEDCEPSIKIYKEYIEPQVVEEYHEEVYYETSGGDCLSSYHGTYNGPSGKETYYNLDMSNIVTDMRNRGYDEEEYPYWVRDDGCKMLGDYIMVAADLEIRPKGTTLDTSLGEAIVCDTGGFAEWNSGQLDIATAW